MLIFEVMNLSSMQLYEQMQQEIGQLEMYCKNEVSLIEGCFNIALCCWNEIKRCLGTYSFICECDEINFFKNTKPLFISEMEFNTLRYQAILFKPDHDKEQLLSYWIHELKRIEIFYSRESAFCQYFDSGQKDKDRCYFTRLCNNGLLQQQKINREISTSHDYIVARILSYRRYQNYVKEKLELLLRDSNNESVAEKKPVLDSMGLNHT